MIHYSVYSHVFISADHWLQHNMLSWGFSFHMCSRNESLVTCPADRTCSAVSGYRVKYIHSLPFSEHQNRSKGAVILRVQTQISITGIRGSLTTRGARERQGEGLIYPNRCRTGLGEWGFHTRVPFHKDVAQLTKMCTNLRKPLLLWKTTPETPISWVSGKL